MATEQNYVLNGPTDFFFPFPVRTSGQLVVSIEPGGVLPPSAYEVIGASATADGVTVRYPDAPRDGLSTLRISRRTELQRVSTFLDDLSITARALNAEFDNVLQIVQDGVLNEFRDDWITERLYFVLDVVRAPDGSLYVCIEQHTSDVFATDLAAERWSLVADFATGQGDIDQGVQDAEAARDKAEQWAEEDEDVPVETGQFSALHHAAKASSSAAAALQSEQNAAPVTAIVNEIQTVAGIESDVTTVAFIESDVTAVAGNNANVTIVATDIANVNTTATNIADVNTVAGDIANVIIVATDITNVNTVAGSIANVNTVSTDIANVNTVAGSISNVNTVAGIDADVSTVVGVSADVTTVAGISTDVTTVAGISGNVTIVAGVEADIVTLAALDTEIAALGDRTVEIDGLYAQLSDITTKVGKTSDTGSAVVPAGTQAQRDGTPSAGYFRFNTDTQSFEGYNGIAWGSVGGGATGGGGDQVFVENDQIVTTDYTISADKNAMTTGPIDIDDGVTVTVETGARWVVI